MLRRIVIAALLSAFCIAASAQNTNIIGGGLLGDRKVSGGGAVTVCGSGWTGPTSGLTHCWPMDSAHVSGTTIQDATGSIAGTAGAGVTAGTGPSGVANSARTFNGTTQPILLASEPVGSAVAASVFFWINKVSDAGSDGDPRWVCWQGTTDISFADGGANGTVDVNVTGAGETSSASAAVGNGAWHHVGMTFDGSSTKIVYLDGSVLSMPNAGVGDGCDPSTWALGGRNATNRLWAGSMATVVVYNRVLSGAEVTTLKNAF